MTTSLPSMENRRLSTHSAWSATPPCGSRPWTRWTDRRPATRSRPCGGRLERALEAGAIGLSTGLYYAPAAAAPTEEIIELVTAVRAAGGIHTTHMRDEADRVSDSLEETFTIGRETGVPVVISHHKCSGAGQPRPLDRDPGADRSSTAAPTNQPRRLPLHRQLDDLGFNQAGGCQQSAGDLVQSAARGGRTGSRRDRSRDGSRPRSCGRSVAARRRDLLHDGRGGRAPHPRLPGHHDRLRRPAARRVPPPAPVGHLPASARPLCARPRPFLCGRSSAQDDWAAGPDVSVWRIGACWRPVRWPTSCFSTQRQ